MQKDGIKRVESLSSASILLHEWKQRENLYLLKISERNLGYIKPNHWSCYIMRSVPG
jgi:hypothetical protein